MRPTSRGYVLAVAIWVCTTPGMLRAQWAVTLEAQRVGFGGTSRDTTDGPHGSFRPDGTLGVTVRLDRRIGRVALGLGIRYLRAAVVLDAPDLFIGIRDDFAGFEAAPEIRVRIVRTSGGATLHLYGGPVIGVWAFSDQGTRPVPGGMAGVAGEFPVLAHLALWVRAGGGLTRSVFRDGELPAEFDRRFTRRSEISLGLRYGR
jgi:hypothetical protein